MILLENIMSQQLIEKAIKEHGLHKEVVVEISLDNDLKDIIAIGRVQFLNDYIEYYFDDKKNIYSKEFVNPTYLDLAVFVNDQIHEMNDFHHVFLEKVLKIEEKNGVQIFSYELGS